MTRNVMIMNKKIQKYILTLAILAASLAYFIRFTGLESTRSDGGLYTSVVCDALTDRPAHVKWVVLSGLGSYHGGNSEFLLVGEKRCYVPSKSHFLWLVHSGESSESNLWYLNKDLSFVSLETSITLSQVNEIHTLMNHREQLSLSARDIVELVIGKQLNITDQQNGS